jgi:hypothetical protein
VLASSPSERRPGLPDLGIALALAASAWLLYLPILHLGWIYDDVYHLRHLITGRPGWYFFDAAEYGRLESRVLTPLLFLSLDVDRRLFGLAPHAFYVHQLLVFGLAPAALYGTLRIWLDRIWASVGAGIFLLGPVAASLTPLLMVRHYIEAVLLACLAVMAWAAAVRRTGPAARALSITSAILYFAAAMAKEIAVPLPVFLLALPQQRERRRLLLPHAAALIAYLIVRYAVLGTLLGGYGFVVEPTGVPRLALSLPGKVAAELVGSGWTGVFFAVSLMIGVGALIVLRRWRAALLLGFALLLALLPVLPVSTRMEPRYALPAWIVAAVAFAIGCQALPRRIGITLAAVACLSGLLLNRQDWNVRLAQAERMSTENRFLLRMGDRDVLRQPLTLAASLGELLWMKRNVYHRPATGRWFQDDFYLCVHKGPLGRVWNWDEDARKIVEVTDTVPALRKNHCSSIRNAPLQADFHVSRDALFWDLGPYREGSYAFLFGDGVIVLPMPRTAGFRMQSRAPLLLRIRYQSPEGWTAYSSEIRIDLADGTRVQHHPNPAPRP